MGPAGHRQFVRSDAARLGRARQRFQMMNM
jgi:hypothetical protein